MRNKLGLFGEDKNDQKLINKLLNWMKNNKADYTNTFCHLMGMKLNDDIYKNEDFMIWTNEWKKRSKLNNSSKEKQYELMKKKLIKKGDKILICGFGVGLSVGSTIMEI